MNSLALPGPVLTYVTDADIDRASQEHVLQQLISCADMYSLRVAFRLPNWSDTDFLSLLDWYQNQIEHVHHPLHLEAPLVHGRPECVRHVPDAALWLPWRHRCSVEESAAAGPVAVSVHSEQEALEAAELGATELVFGHVFATESHPGEPGRGAESLAQLNAAFDGYQVPPRVTAIGGINEHTIPELGRTGHGSVALMRSISQSKDIHQTLDRICSSWIAARTNEEWDSNRHNPLQNPANIFF